MKRYMYRFANPAAVVNPIRFCILFVAFAVLFHVLLALVGEVDLLGVVGFVKELGGVRVTHELQIEWKKR